MTTQQEIDAVTERLKVLKEKQYTENADAMNKSKAQFMERADTLDPRWKELYHSINNAVETAGWKDFYYAVLKYQKECVDSGYQFK